MMEIKLFSRNISVLKLLGGTGTVIGAFLGINSLISWYHEKTISDISGKWKVETITETTSLSRFKNMKLGYVIYVQQDHGTLHGNGEKMEENNIAIPALIRTPIEVTGVFDGETIKLTVKENGKKRETRGMYVLHGTNENKIYEGTFNSTAANSSGKCFLKIINN